MKCNYGQQGVHICGDKCRSCVKMDGIHAKRDLAVQYFKGEKWAAVFNSEFNGGVEIALSLKLRKLRTILVPHPPS